MAFSNNIPPHILKQFQIKATQLGHTRLMMMFVKFNTTTYSPYCKPQYRGFLTMKQSKELKHATRLEF